MVRQKLKKKEKKDPLCLGCKRQGYSFHKCSDHSEISGVCLKGCCRCTKFEAVKK